MIGRLTGAEIPPGSQCASGDAAGCPQLRDTYADPKFNNLDHKPGNSIFETIGRAITDFMRWLGQHVGGRPAMAILIAVVVALAGYLIWRFGVVPGRFRRATHSDDAPSALTASAAAEWRIALAAADAGDYREAVRRAFRSVLLEVAHHGRLRVDASWTTRELLDAALGDADLVATLAPAAASFDLAWYSGREVTRDDWGVARARCETVRHLARRRREVAVAV